LTQFTRDCFTTNVRCYNCVAISTSPDPTGTYYRYAFVSQDDAVPNTSVLPDYPKYGVWSDSYVLTTTDFARAGFSGVSVYALEKNRMLVGDATARAVQFVLSSAAPISIPFDLFGGGLLPPDIDGRRLPPNGRPIPIVGSMDDDLGALSDGLNVWELSVDWSDPTVSSFVFVGGLPTASFDSDFPCTAGVQPSRQNACIAQPGTTTKLDVLSYVPRLFHRLAYRNFGEYESMVSTLPVEARPGIAGTRWYEIRRLQDGTYNIFQQGTFSPNDGVNRWMGSIAQDAAGNMAIGYSVSSDTVFPGIRYAGRLAQDALGTMSLGEGTIIDGSGSQTGENRWGDYTSMNIDPSDDCTFWYVNEYYATSSDRNWQTRIASFTLPGCITPMPTPLPTPMPTPLPTPMPTPLSAPMPTPLPTPMPTPLPTPMPTPFPTPMPTLSPTSMGKKGTLPPLSMGKKGTLPPLSMGKKGSKQMSSTAGKEDTLDLLLEDF
jgi:hypothetical protein